MWLGRFSFSFTIKPSHKTIQILLKNLKLLLFYCILIGSLHSRGPGGSILSNNENISKNPKILKENYIFKGFLLMVEGRLAVIEMETNLPCT